MDLTYKNEKKLFTIAAVISAIVWIGVIVGTIGIALIYLLFGYLVFLFAHSGFISYLKGTGVRITESQYPDLYERLIRCSKTVGLDDIPDAYLLRTDFFNALATKFLGRHFVVLYTDVLDALEDQPGALDFYIGHEIGHIHRKHLNWGVFLFPALLLPILGTAYRRAQEYTCDRYGAACCESDDDVLAAIAAIAAGNTRWKSISKDAYLEQIAITNGFWMSFNEITGDYPWLTKRMDAALAYREKREISHPRRHSFAWILAMFIPRFGAGGAVSMLVTIAMIGVLAAVAIPAYQDYTIRASNQVAYQASVPLQDQVVAYASQSEAWPVTLLDLGYEAETIVGPDDKYRISLYENGLIGTDVGVGADGETMYIVLEPSVEESGVYWTCYGQNIAAKYLPAICRQ